MFGVGGNPCEGCRTCGEDDLTTLYGIMGATAGWLAKAGIAAATTALGPVGAAGGFSLLMYGVGPAIGMLSGMTWGFSVGALTGQAASETVKAHWAMFIRNGLNHDVLPYMNI